jgi:hypothetical protein
MQDQRNCQWSCGVPPSAEANATKVDPKKSPWTNTTETTSECDPEAISMWCEMLCECGVKGHIRRQGTIEKQSSCRWSCSRCQGASVLKTQDTCSDLDSQKKNSSTDDGETLSNYDIADMLGDDDEQTIFSENSEAISESDNLAGVSLVGSMIAKDITNSSVGKSSLADKSFIS